MLLLVKRFIELIFVEQNPCLDPSLHDCDSVAECFSESPGYFQCQCPKGFADLSPDKRFPGRKCKKSKLHFFSAFFCIFLPVFFFFRFSFFTDDFNYKKFGFKNNFEKHQLSISKNYWCDGQIIPPNVNESYFLLFVSVATVIC